MFKNIRRALGFGKFAILFTMLLGAIAILLVLLPEEWRTAKLIIGIGSISIFILSWSVTALYFKRTTKPIRGAADIFKKCAVKFRNQKEKIAECVQEKFMGAL